jgi:hypothetical protein
MTGPPDHPDGRRQVDYLGHPLDADLVHVLVLVNLDISAEQEPLDSAEVVDYGLRVDASRVVPLDEPDQNVYDVLIIDLRNLPLFTELAEFSQRDPVESPAVYGVTLPEHRMNEPVLPFSLRAPLKTPALEHLLHN